jgi:hypothetical protein
MPEKHMTPYLIDGRLADLRYEPQNFSDLFATVGQQVWDFMRRYDNVIRMETATFLERAAVEPLGPCLLDEFGAEINQDRHRQMIGHMARQVMEAIGYEVDRSSLRLTRLNMFTTATAYRRRGLARDRGMQITREQREKWASETANSDFNIWLNGRVRRADGTLDIEALYTTAKEFGVAHEYRHLNPGQQRMNIGSRLRSVVPPETYRPKSA